MIDIRCSGDAFVTLADLTPFQGELKKRTKAQMDQLKESLVNEGLLMPFVVWETEGEKYLLDGHTRLLVLSGLAMSDRSLSAQQFPVIYIKASSVDEAKKALLQITSQYGRIDKQGAVKFCASIPEYRAPSVKCIYRRPYSKRSTSEKIKSVDASTVAPQGEVIMKISVPAAYEKAVRDLFMSVSYIKVL